MKKYRMIEIPEEEVINGEVVYNLGSNMADADPFLYNRLLKAGKLKAARKMLNEKGYWALKEDGTYM